MPKNLETMWQEHLEAYGVEGARVVPYSMVDKGPSRPQGSSNLSSATSRTTCEMTRPKRMRPSATTCGETPARCCSLTATPYNLAFADVANQLALYIDEDEDLGIVPSAAMAKDPTLADKVDGKTNTLEAFKRSEEADDWRRLMSDHLVRRTRRLHQEDRAEEGRDTGRRDDSDSRVSAVLRRDRLLLPHARIPHP